MAIAPDQVFVKIPARRLDRTFGRRPFVERMLVPDPAPGLRGKRKGHAVVVMRGLHDVDRRARFLAAEIVGRHADDLSPRSW